MNDAWRWSMEKGDATYMPDTTIHAVENSLVHLDDANRVKKRGESVRGT